MAGEGDWWNTANEVIVRRMPSVTWFEAPAEAKPIGVRDSTALGQATIFMNQPFEHPPKSDPKIEHRYHLFMFLLIGDRMEAEHTGHPLGVVKVRHRPNSPKEGESPWEENEPIGPWLYAVFYLGAHTHVPLKYSELRRASKGDLRPRSGH